MNPAEAIASQNLIVVCGPGGVGKTTTSAAFGLAAARLGRKALVITVDPAKRLGEALGEKELGNEPRQVPPELIDPTGKSEGELWALMLHQEETADTLIRQSASSPEAAQRILDNRIYRVLASALASTEYMAVERLHQLWSLDKFDLFVLDTPPSKNALDFLDSPQWASRVLDQRIITWFLRTAHSEKPTERGMAAAVMYKTAMLVSDLLGRLLGHEFFDELTDFFEVFVDISEHLKDHAEEVERLLRHEKTTFFVASSPEQGAIEESTRLAQELFKRALGFGGFVVNRVESNVLPMTKEQLEQYAREVGAQDDSLTAVQEALDRVWSEQLAIRSRDEAAIEQLGRAAGQSAAIHSVPRLGDDLAGILDLARFATCLVGEPSGK